VMRPGATSAVLPPDWRGRITYSGVQEGRIDTPGRPIRRLSVESVVGSVTSANSETFGGSYDLTLNFDGPRVTGTYRLGSGRGSGEISGTRTGSRCRLFARDTAIEGECTQAAFIATGQGPAGGRRTQSFRIDAQATEVVDAVAEEARRAEAAEQAAAERAEAEARRAEEAAAERARIAAMPMATGAQVQLVERAVRQDSGAWAWNRFDIGSITNVRVAERSGGATTLRAEYTYNGGSPGWVLARVVDGRVDCLGYWDFGGCAEVRTGSTASGSRETHAVVAVEDYDWFEVHSPGEATAWVAVANVRRWDTDTVRYYQMSLFHDDAGFNIAESEADCRQKTIRTIAWGSSQDPYTLRRVDDEAVRTSEGTKGRNQLEMICSRNGWRPVSRPEAAARAWQERVR
jgi:hypothetical protein